MRPVVTYKPGWAFEWDGVDLCLTRTLPNADGGSQPFTDGYRMPFPEGLDVHRLGARLFDLERHEVQEWLRVDGVRVLGPHRHD